MGGVPEGLIPGAAFELGRTELGVLVAVEIPKDDGLWLPTSYYEAEATEVWARANAHAVVGVALDNGFAGGALRIQLGDQRAHYEPPAIDEAKLAPKPRPKTPTRYPRQLRSTLACGDRLAWGDDELTERCELIDDVLDAGLPEVQEP